MQPIKRPRCFSNSSTEVPDAKRQKQKEGMAVEKEMGTKMSIALIMPEILFRIAAFLPRIEEERLSILSKEHYQIIGNGFFWQKACKRLDCSERAGKSFKTIFYEAIQAGNFFAFAIAIFKWKREESDGFLFSMEKTRNLFNLLTQNPPRNSGEQARFLYLIANTQPKLQARLVTFEKVYLHPHASINDKIFAWCQLVKNYSSLKEKYYKENEDWLLSHETIQKYSNEYEAYFKERNIKKKALGLLKIERAHRSFKENKEDAFHVLKLASESPSLKIKALAHREASILYFQIKDYEKSWDSAVKHLFYTTLLFNLRPNSRTLKPEIKSEELKIAGEPIDMAQKQIKIAHEQIDAEKLITAQEKIENAQEQIEQAQEQIKTEELKISLGQIKRVDIKILQEQIKIAQGQVEIIQDQLKSVQEQMQVEGMRLAKEQIKKGDREGALNTLAFLLIKYNLPYIVARLCNCLPNILKFYTPDNLKSMTCINILEAFICTSERMADAAKTPTNIHRHVEFLYTRNVYFIQKISLSLKILPLEQIPFEEYIQKCMKIGKGPLYEPLVSFWIFKLIYLFWKIELVPHIHIQSFLSWPAASEDQKKELLLMKMILNIILNPNLPIQLKEIPLDSLTVEDKILLKGLIAWSHFEKNSKEITREEAEQGLNQYALFVETPEGQNYMRNHPKVRELLSGLLR